MTVGVGFLCGDGVVICADRQLTVDDAYKFAERKIAHYHGVGCQIILSYAGFYDTGNVMVRKVREGFESVLESATGQYPHQRVRDALERLFCDPITDGLQTLIGVRVGEMPPFLFRTQGSLVLDGEVEYIGTGDGSALRYIMGFLSQESRTVDEASVLGSYLVSVANRFIDGCSGGPDVTILLDNGSISENSGGVFPNQEARFALCEREIGNELRSLLLKGGSR